MKLYVVATDSKDMRVQLSDWTGVETVQEAEKLANELEETTGKLQHIWVVEIRQLV